MSNTYTIGRDESGFIVTLAGEQGLGGHEILGFPSEGMVRDWLRGTLGVEAEEPLPLYEARTYP